MDALTLLLSVLVNALLMSTALAVCVGLRLRSGLQAWQFALLAQAVGFGMLMGSVQVATGPLSTLGVALLSASVSAMLVTASRYLAQPIDARWLWAPPLALGLVHAVVFDNRVVAVAITNITIGIQTLAFAWLLLRGSRGRRWRWLCGWAGAGNGVMMLARAALIIGFPESYPRFIAPHPLNFAHLLLLNASLVLGTVGFLLAHRDEAEQALVRLASVDALTGLLNRREWWSRAQLALQRGGPAPALLLLDLDHFKAVNDQHGHPVGDRVLALTGEVLSSHTRASDLAGRYGGEEFCLLLRAPDGPVLRAIDERLHEALRDKSLAALGFAVDFSAGAVRVQPGETLDAAVQRADQALYRAKGNGRAQTCWADTPL